MFAVTVPAIVGFLYLGFAAFCLVVAAWVLRLVDQDRRAYKSGRASRHVERAEQIAQGLGPRPEVAELVAELEAARSTLDDEGGAR